MNGPTLQEAQAETKYRQEQCRRSVPQKPFVFAWGKMLGRIVVWHPKGERPA